MTETRLSQCMLGYLTSLDQNRKLRILLLHITFILKRSFLRYQNRVLAARSECHIQRRPTGSYDVHDVTLVMGFILKKYKTFPVFMYSYIVSTRVEIGKTGKIRVFSISTSVV